MGYVLATLFANGIPSASHVVYLGDLPAPTVTPTATKTPNLTPSTTRTPKSGTPVPHHLFLPDIANGSSAGW
jgi:hypothetical protein